MYGVVLRWCQPPQTSPSGWPEPPPAVPCHFFSPKRIVLHGIPIKSPTGKKFRSKPQLSRYLGNTVDLGCFDFRTGKMMPGKLQKNKQRLRHDPLSLSKEGKPDQEGGREKGKEQKKEGRKEQGGKPDLNTALPIRQTASIFKQPVTKVTSHPGNKVKADLQRGAEQPRQLFWERRLKGLRSSDVTEEVLRTMDLPKGLQSVGPDSSDDTLLSAIASALHMSSAPITGQTSVAAEKNPAIWMNTSQPLCKAFTVTDDHIREQELKVYQARRSLEEALMADGLARAAENTRELLEGKKA
ncbi:methyl-CpG-binding domain protein 2 isoform X1 [Siniperca chuatsi]|uniref:methyl-CpG-binding domain protein 2 isoform X1 n=1 Tax=Siniperca chuatsi TaxID=119488 RepID=UPI001CE224F0|nr:methyl-CpG-binding domain protein 2 isoform X1 [Siniperca chuatsi]XP_044029799.1 methyl-CpG-binding domain protein 2 isoform X1 [Siniperca chuatsi]XP_044029800.1 methyl-CpG-binding domain protein 2 isoform X1 [Siniperca chuatsi]